MSETLYNTLLSLRDAKAIEREAEATLAAKAAPLQEQIDALKAKLDALTSEEVADLAAAAAWVQDLRAEVNAAYNELVTDRDRRLLEGEEVPRFEPPQGLSFSPTKRLAVDCASALPKDAYIVDEKGLTRRLKAGEDVRGARLIDYYTVRITQ
jgi:hypothetical protein